MAPLWSCGLAVVSWSQREKHKEFDFGHRSRWPRCGLVVLLWSCCGLAVVLLWPRCGLAVVLLWPRCGLAEQLEQKQLEQNKLEQKKLEQKIARTKTARTKNS